MYQMKIRIAFELRKCRGANLRGAESIETEHAMRRFGETVAGTISINDDNAAPRAYELHGCREPGKTAADNKDIYVHRASLVTIKVS